MIRPAARRAVSVLILALAAASATAELLPIINPSFEDTGRPLAVGEQTNGAGGAATPVATRFPFAGGSVSWDSPANVSGWRTRLRPFGDTAVVRAGILNPPLIGGQPFATGHDGTNLLAIQAAQIGQTLQVPLLPNTNYQLRFLGGIGRFDSSYALSVSLIAAADPDALPLEGEVGVTRLAITQGLIPPAATFGTLLPYSLSYTSPSTLPPNLAGQFIGIHMYGSDGIPRVLFDNFSLEATPVPEPAALALVLALLIRRR